MSKHGSLHLHPREEAVTVDLAALLKPVPAHIARSPISDYFEVTDRLKAKIIGASVAADSEMFGLLTIGVISAVEFYLRSVFSRVPEVCPLARRHLEMVAVPAGAPAFYGDSGLPYLLSSFDHESLADGRKIRTICERYVGFKISDDSSASRVVDDFDRLCELRHCLVHSRGFVGLKASNALGLAARMPQKVLMDSTHVFEVLKISHNVVRAVNRFLAEQIASRWVDSGVLSGDWARDKGAFTALFNAFCMKGKDAYDGNSYRAYRPYQKAAIARATALLAKVSAG